MAEKKTNLNAGHRERMRKRYIAGGLNGFQPHEVLEMLLFNVITRRDTNKMAHELINKFRTLAGVMDAERSELMEIDGVGEQAAVFLTMLPEVFKAYEMSKHSDRITIEKNYQLTNYLKNLYIDEVVEKAHVLCIDAANRIVCTEEVSEGSSSSVNIDIYNIVETAVRNRVTQVLLVHNHPDGDPTPSDQDVYYTNCIYKALKGVGITLKDHYIIGSYPLSMVKNGYLNL
jgi:DNA repair protein RadC